MVEAVKRSGKVLQVGTQVAAPRSSGTPSSASEGGAIGEILVAEAWNSQLRGAIGKSKPVTPPDRLDFDLWVGPALMVPYRPNLLPSIWRRWYDFGCGDIGNDGGA